MFVARVSGDFMSGSGIYDGDLIMINRPPRHRQVVVAMIDNELTCKRLHKQNADVRLVTANPALPDIVPRDGELWKIWGVVTG